ncbi:unnamed protein product [Caenorhabditis sp. 36 PRJEB53466]|nr:unnamed protein product [Caenorhabditis sp. 36 PRJEB53466]
MSTRCSIHDMLTYPSLPLNAYFQDLAFVDILNLSLCADETKTFVKRLGWRPEVCRLTFGSVVGGATFTVELSFERKERNVKWVVPRERLEKPYKGVEMKRMRIAGMTLLAGEMGETPFPNVFRSELDEPDAHFKVFEHVCKFLLERFPPVKVDVENHCLLPTEISKFVKSASYAKCVRRLSMREKSPKLDARQTEHLLKTMQLEELTMEKIRVEAECQHALKHSKMSISCANWLKPINILSMRCTHLTLWQVPSFGNEELNAFLKKWIKSSFRNLEVFTCYRIRSPPYTYEHVLRGMEADEWKPGSRPRNHALRRSEGVSCRTGRDIQRRNGTLGTVLIKLPSKFEFYVWKDKYLESYH